MRSFLKILSPFLFLPIFLTAQDAQNRSKSLQMALKNAVNDTIRMHVYSQLVYFFEEVNRDSALFYAEKQLAIAKQLDLKLDEVSALGQKAYVLMQMGNLPKSLESFLQALKIAEDPGSEKNVLSLPNGETPRTMRNLALGWIYHDMGHLYGATSNTALQISSYLKAKSIAESNHFNSLLGYADMNLGNVYFANDSLGKLDSALILAQEALAIFSNTDEKFEGSVLNTIGNIYLRKGFSDSSLKTLHKAAKINMEQNNISNLGGSYKLLSDLYMTLKKSDSSLIYARKALETYMITDDSYGMAKSYKSLSSIYSEQNRPDSAFVYLKLASGLNDSLNIVSRKNLLAYQRVGFDEQIRIEKLEKERTETQTRIRTYALLGGIAVFMAIAFLLYRNNLNRKRSNVILQRQKEELHSTLSELKSTQSQLIHSEKMASLGELTAGIAHEIQNPLNFVNNFSELNKEILTEMNEVIENGNLEEVKVIAKNIVANEEKINHHGKRADAIVKSMLQHAQAGSAQKEPTDINALADKYFRLSYQGLRAKDKAFGASLETNYDQSIGMINIIPQDIGRVLFNLCNNAFYAVSEKKKQHPEGYEPTISLSSRKVNDKIEVSVKDNGNGIPAKILDKIFQPFFTTKPSGQGTGLGLSLSYDTMKAHGGEIKVRSNEGEFTEFLILLPISA